MRQLQPSPRRWFYKCPRWSIGISSNDSIKMCVLPSSSVLISWNGSEEVYHQSVYLNQSTACSPPLHLSGLMTRPPLSVCPPIVRDLDSPPPLGATAWLHIIGRIQSLCHISPAGVFPPFIPSRSSLKLLQLFFCKHVLLQTKTQRQNKAATDAKHLPCCLGRSSPSRSHIADCQPSAHRAHPYLLTAKTTRELL